MISNKAKESFELLFHHGLVKFNLASKVEDLAELRLGIIKHYARATLLTVSALNFKVLLLFSTSKAYEGKNDDELKELQNNVSGFVKAELNPFVHNIGISTPHEIKLGSRHVEDWLTFPFALLLCEKSNPHLCFGMFVKSYGTVDFYVDQNKLLDNNNSVLELF
jgi:hypothetical protein